MLLWYDMFWLTWLVFLSIYICTYIPYDVNILHLVVCTLNMLCNYIATLVTFTCTRILKSLAPSCCAVKFLCS